MLAGDWVALAKELELSDSDINIIKSQYPDNAPQQGIVMLRLWMQVSGNKATGNTLEKALRAIHRDDIVDECICNLEVVTDDSEKAVAKKQMEVPPLGVNKGASPEVSYEEKDIMKEAESAEEEEDSHKILQDGFTQPSAEASQMVQGPPAPSDVKPTAPVVPAGHVITEQRPIEKEIGDFESSAADGPKVEARTKSPLREADLSVLDSLMTTQDAQIEEMTFTHTMDDTQAQKDNVTRSQPSFSSQFQSETDSTNAKPKLPPKNKAGTKRRAPPPPPRKDPIEATDKKDPDVSPKKARGAPEWGGQTSSDEGEEQLTLMRDSPRWEDEEIQAEDHDEPRPIKAEIKLLVKTTELGKESIEIRSIREFMDPKDKTVADADASEGQAKGETLQHISLSTTSEDTHAHHHPSPQGGKASPRFVRPKETFSSHEKETDDFDLMAQVRDVIAETETEKAFITHCDSDQESSKKSPKKKKKGPK